MADPLESAFGAEPAETMVCGLVDELVEGAFAALEDKDRDARAVHSAVHSATSERLGALRLFFISPDPGPGTVLTEPPPDEPVPAPIDSWSRGAVQTRARAPPPPLGAAPPTPRGSSAGSRKSPRGRPRSREDETSPTSLPAGGAVFVAKRAAALSDAQKARDAPAAVPTATAEELRAQRRAAEEREVREREARLRAELKGREYTTDAAGNVILVDGVKPERLPAFKQNPRVELAQKAPEAPSAKGAGGRQARRGSTQRNDGGGKPRIDFGRGATSFEPLDTLQPPLLDSMVMTHGVTLREGEASKAGGNRTFDEGRMSRKDYDLFSRTTVGERTQMTDVAEQPIEPAPPTVDPSPPLAHDPDDINMQLMAKDWGVNPPVREVPTPPRRPRRSPPLNRRPRAQVRPAPLPHKQKPALSTRAREGTMGTEHLPPPIYPASSRRG